MLLGSLDALDWRGARGWAHDADRPDSPVELEIRDQEDVLVRFVADQYRPDLDEAGLGRGRRAFSVQFAHGLSGLRAHRLRVLRTSDGAELPGSPVWLTSDGLTEPTKRTIEAMIATIAATNDATADAELDAALAAMLHQTEAVLQARAALPGGHVREAETEAFRRRWQAERPTLVGMSRPAVPGRRALFIDSALPRPERDAGSCAALDHVRALCALGFSVTFVPARTMRAEAGPTAALATLGVTVCAAPAFVSAEEVLRRNAGLFDLVYLHRVENAQNYAGLVRTHCPDARLVYGVADLHHVRLARRAAVERFPEARAASAALRQQELFAAWLSDAVITHSTEEATLLRRAVPRAEVHVVPWSLRPRPRTRPFAERAGIAFIGSYQHSPNLDAAKFLAAEVMPVLARHAPGIRLLLVGSDMPNEIRALACANIEAIGPVADLDAIFDQVRLTVAPLRYGAGLKGKVLDSLAAGVPCVCSAIAAEGMGLPAPLAAAIANTPDALVRSILNLHDDEVAHQACASAGLAWIETEFAPARIDDLMRVAAGLAPSV